MIHKISSYHVVKKWTGHFKQLLNQILCSHGDEDGDAGIWASYYF